MATGQEWGQALQGMGAWFSGQGPQYEAAKALEARTTADDERQRRMDALAMNKERVAAMVQDYGQTLSLINAGRADLALQLLDSRIPMIGQMGGDPSDTITLRQKIAEGSPDVVPELTAFLTAAGSLKPANSGQPKRTSDGGMAVYDPTSNSMVPVNTGGMNFNTPAAPDTGEAQKGSTQVVMIGGKPHLSGSVFDPQSGQWSAQLIPMEDPTGAGGTVEIPDASGLPPSLRPDQKIRESAATAAGEAAIKRSEAYFDRVDAARATISGIDEAIAAIDEGANTGTLAQYLPSLRESSKRLDAAGRRMGLDVVGAVTFGALSKGELDVAMATALPKDMAPPQLRQWLEARKAAQMKLANYLESAAIYLGETDDSGKPHTVAGFKRMQKEGIATGDPRATEANVPRGTQPSGFKVRSVK
jgi:hypothetical protein